MAQDVNTVALVGRLTRDPELRATSGGSSVCSLRLALSERTKDSVTGEWSDRSNYFDVSVFGNQAESCQRYLAKGRQIAVQGRLQWREWETQDGTKRQAVQVIANTVQFLSNGQQSGDNTGGSPQQQKSWDEIGDLPVEPVTVPQAAADDEDESIPF